MNNPQISTSRIATGLLENASRWKHLAILVTLFAAMAAFAPLTYCQENATVTGTVTDASGAVVPNAKVTLTNTATSVKREVTSNSVGAYRFPNVGIGTYDMDVTASGFAKFTRTGIVVNVASSLEEDAKLNIGSQAQTVTVAAQALQVQTETSEVSTLISGEQVRQLSTNGRNIVQLAALGMGVSSNYEFNRNTAYNANDYFNQQAGRPRPEFMLNEPGGNIGGPVWIPHIYNTNKTRTFFFWNEEWRRLIQGSAPSTYNTLMNSNFPTAGRDPLYTPPKGKAPTVPDLPGNAGYTAKETAAGSTCPQRLYLADAGQGRFCLLPNG